jgi:hypothetical protein
MRPGAPTAVRNSGRPCVEKRSSMQLIWNRSRMYRPGVGTPSSISRANASKLMPAWETMSAYMIGATLGRGLAWYSPNGSVTLTSVRACGSMFLTCATSSRVSSIVCSKLSVKARLVCRPLHTFQTATALR